MFESDEHLRTKRTLRHNGVQRAREYLVGIFLKKSVLEKIQTRKTTILRLRSRRPSSQPRTAHFVAGLVDRLDRPLGDDVRRVDFVAGQVVDDVWIFGI